MFFLTSVFNMVTENDDVVDVGKIGTIRGVVFLISFKNVCVSLQVI